MKKFNINPDLLGATTSIICALHCITVPILLTIFPMASLQFLENELIEIGAMALGVTIATFSLAKGYLKIHKNIRPVIWMVAGFCALWISHHDHLAEHGWKEFSLIGFGGFAIAFAHYHNWRLSQQNEIPSQSAIESLK